MTSPRVPDPPANIGDLDLEIIQWDAQLFRWFRRDRNPAEFNPGRGMGRFHPIKDACGKSIPTLYCATDLAGAAMETVFRTTPADAVPRAVPRKLIDQYDCKMFVIGRVVPILPLWGNNLRRLRLTRNRLLEPGPIHYPRTARWAEALHRACPTIAGLAWHSRQFDGSTCLVLFSDRIRPAKLHIFPYLGSQTDTAKPAYIELLEIATAADITIYEA